MAAVSGGVLGTLDLRLPYVLACVAALAATAAALRFRPIDETRQSGSRLAPGFGQSLRDCAARIGDRSLGWLFALSIAATVVNHVPYEFYQPYLDQHAFLPWPADATPALAGLHLASAQLAAAPIARMSSRLARRIGTYKHLYLSVLYQVLLIALMARFAHPMVALALLTRSVPRALQTAPLREAIAPRLPANLRATYLSMQSLAGRLGFAGLLGVLALFASRDVTTALRMSAMIAAALSVALGVLAVALRPWTVAATARGRA